MIPVSRIVKDYREAGAMNTLIGLYGFVDEHCFLTKGGDLGVVLRVEGAVLVLAILAAEAAIFFVISFGYIAAAVCVLLGPIFIPFFIVPKLEWMFWGWFKAFLQYAFYQVVANAYLFVFGNLLVHFVDSHPPPYDGAALLLLFAPLLFLLIAFTYGILRIPSLVNSLFSGSSGEAAFPRIF